MTCSHVSTPVFHAQHRFCFGFCWCCYCCYCLLMMQHNWTNYLLMINCENDRRVPLQVNFFMPNAHTIRHLMQLNLMIDHWIKPIGHWQSSSTQKYRQFHYTSSQIEPIVFSRTKISPEFFYRIIKSKR